MNAAQVEARRRAAAQLDQEQKLRAAQLQQQQQQLEAARIARKRRRCPPSFDLRDMVTLSVGQDEQQYTLPRAVLGRVPYFKSALNFNEKSSTTSKLTLRDVDAELFHIYSVWAVNRELPAFEGVDKRQMTSQELAELWLLGDFLCDTVFQNCIIDKLIKAHTCTEYLWPPPVTVAAFVWTKTVPEAKIRVLFLDLYLSWGPAELLYFKREFHGDGVAVGTELLYDILMNHLARGKRTKLRSAEEYYETEDEE